MEVNPTDFISIQNIYSLIDQVARDFHGLPDSILRDAAGFKSVCIFVNKRILPEQVKILKENGNSLVLCCSAG